MVLQLFRLEYLTASGSVSTLYMRPDNTYGVRVEYITVAWRWRLTPTVRWLQVVVILRRTVLICWQFCQNNNNKL